MPPAVEGSKSPTKKRCFWAPESLKSIFEGQTSGVRSNIEHHLTSLVYHHVTWSNIIQPTIFEPWFFVMVSINSLVFSPGPFRLVLAQATALVTLAVLRGPPNAKGTSYFSGGKQLRLRSNKWWDKPWKMLGVNKKNYKPTELKSRIFPVETRWNS